MTPQELGQRVKAKYPQYASLSDEDVATRVSAKYPQYQAQLQVPESHDDTPKDVRQPDFGKIFEPYSMPSQSSGVLDTAINTVKGMSQLAPGMQSLAAGEEATSQGQDMALDRAKVSTNPIQRNLMKLGLNIMTPLPSMQGTIGRSAIKGVAKGATAPIRNLPSPGDLMNVTKNELPFIERMSGEFKSAERGLGQTFGKQLDDLSNANPERFVNAGEALANLQESMALSPHLKSLVNETDTPLIARYLANPNIAENVSLREMQNAINELTSQTTIRKLQGLGVRPNDNPFMGVINDFKDAQLSAFPEMSGVRKEFRTGKEAAKTLRPKFQERSMSRALKTGFDENPVLKRDLERLLPKKVVGELYGATKAKRTIGLGKEVFKRTATSAIPIGGIGYLLSRLMGKKD